MVSSRCRRFAQVSSSEDEEDIVRETRSQGQNSGTRERKRRHCKKVRHYEESDEDEETEREGKKDEDEMPPKEVKPVDVKPVGEPVKVTSKGKGKRKVIINHYGQFEYGGKRYELDDTVLLYPEDKREMPYIAIIKDITQKKDGTMMLLGQWFYRQEEAKKKGGGHWEVRDSRELFYSFHLDEFPPQSVMHRCVVYFVPAHKKLPKRKDHPGFIVRKVYDTVDKKLLKLTDKDYEVAKQHEIDLLVEKSMSRLGDLPDLETEDDLDKAKTSS